MTRTRRLILPSAAAVLLWASFGCGDALLPTQSELAEIEAEMAADSSWIVYFVRDAVEDVEARAHELTEAHDGTLRRVWTGLEGFLAKFGPEAVWHLRRLPEIAVIGPIVPFQFAGPDPGTSSRSALTSPSDRALWPHFVPANKPLLTFRPSVPPTL